MRRWLPLDPQQFDRVIEVGIERNVGHALDVVAASSGLQITAAIIDGRVPTAVPGEVIDLDEELVLGDAQIGTDYFTLAQHQPMFADG